MYYASIIDAIGNTPMVELRRTSPKDGVRIFAKLEGQNPTGSVKDRIAKYMIEAAEAAGTLTRDRVILEPTSGNTGISIAMIGRLKGYRVKVVMPENVSIERRQLLDSYGAEIILSDGKRGSNGSIQVAQELARNDDIYFMPYQYGNEANPKAHYEGTAVEILRDLPDVDVFIAGLGTGGHAHRRRAAAQGAQPRHQGRRRRAAPGRAHPGPPQPRGRLHPADPRPVRPRWAAHHHQPRVLRGDAGALRARGASSPASPAAPSWPAPKRSPSA